MSIPNYLVVGINGVIGSSLFSRLQSTVSFGSVYGTTQRRDILRPARSNIFYLNLLDDASSWSFENIQFDVVYLCAGICRMALCEDDPIVTRKVNVDGMIALARRLSGMGAFIVYLSTNQVFSGNEKFVSEDAPYQPLNEYGYQKMITEQLIKKYCQQWAIVRLTKVIEPNMPLVQKWIDQLFHYQPVEAFTDMMAAPVTLRQVIDVLLHIGQKKQTGCYHISGGEDVSYYTLANYLALALGRSSLVQPVSAIEKGIKKSFLPRFTTLDCSSTITLLDSVRPPLFYEVLHECFDF